MSTRWPLALALLVAGCAAAPVQERPAGDEARTQSSPPAEVTLNAEDSLVPEEPEPEPAPEPEPVDTTCEDLVVSATQIAAGGELELPDPYTVVLADELDPAMEEEFGWHPLGITLGDEVTVWPELHAGEEAVTFTVLHELGHLFEDACLSASDKNEWLVTRGLERPWYTDDYYTSPSEDFADSFAVCHTDTDEWWTLDLEPPGAEDCEELARIAAPRR